MDNDNDNYGYGSTDNSSNWQYDPQPQSQPEPWQYSPQPDANPFSSDNGYNNGNNAYGSDDYSTPPPINNQEDEYTPPHHHHYEHQNRDPEKSRLDNHSNLNGLRPGKDEFHEQLPDGSGFGFNGTNNNSGIKSSLPSPMALAMMSDALSLGRKKKAQSSEPLTSEQEKLNQDKLNSEIKAHKDSLKMKEEAQKHTEEIEKNYADAELRELFKSHRPLDTNTIEDRLKNFRTQRHPFIKAQKIIFKFISVTAVAVAALVSVNTLVTPHVDTTAMNAEQITQTQQTENTLSAGMSDFELAIKQPIRAIDQMIPKVLTTLIGHGKDIRILSSQQRQDIAQATLNKMLKDYPAYPEANNQFLVENSKNYEVRVNIMKNLLKTDHFKKRGETVLTLLEDTYFNNAIKKNNDVSINQTRSYPFQYADDGLVGTKILQNKETLSNSGRLSSLVSSDSPITKKILGYGDYVTIPVHYVYNFITSPTIKIKGIFSSESLNQYTNDPTKTNGKAFFEATNPNAPLPEPIPFKSNNPELNKVRAEVSKGVIFEKDGGENMAKSMDLSVQEFINASKAAMKDNKKEKENHAKLLEDRQKILDRVKTVVQPNPKTAEEDKAKGLEMIENVKKSKPN